MDGWAPIACCLRASISASSSAGSAPITVAPTCGPPFHSIDSGT